MSALWVYRFENNDFKKVPLSYFEIVMSADKRKEYAGETFLFAVTRVELEGGFLLSFGEPAFMKAVFDDSGVRAKEEKSVNCLEDDALAHKLKDMNYWEPAEEQENLLRSILENQILA
jgi:hypothetical protein